MKIEELKKAIESVSPTDEQKNKMLNTILDSEKSQNEPKILYLRRYSVVAAVVVIGLIAVAYPKLYVTNDLHNSVEKSDTMQVLPNTDESQADDKVKTEQDSSFSYLLETVETDSTKNTPAKNVEDITKPVGEINTNADDTVNHNEIADEEIPKEASDFTDSMPNDNASAIAVAIDTEVAVGTDVFDVNDMSLEADDKMTNTAMKMRSAMPEMSYISMHDIKIHEVFGTLYPKKIINGFVFNSAGSTGTYLSSELYNGNKNMKISIVEEDMLDTSVEVVNPNDILDMESNNGNFNFAVKCGGYYVLYDVDTDDSMQLFVMVTSSDYFGN